ncbi:hypothetical protein V6N13_128367 [Hibiscus sabdariffa]|uniref:Pentatricopeptide repeat-containing protein n=1 Tax=Hibiscus sabdariffa TaxID=183260 RepID=A0ABR2P1L5_9ROSI
MAGAEVSPVDLRECDADGGEGGGSNETYAVFEAIGFRSHWWDSFRVSNRAEVYRVWEAMKRAFPTVPNSSYYVMIEALAKLKDFEGLKKWFEDWESRFSRYDVRLATSMISCYLSEDMLEEAELVLDRAVKRSEDPLATARERFMVYFLKKLF